MYDCAFYTTESIRKIGSGTVCGNSKTFALVVRVLKSFNCQKVFIMFPLNV